MPARVLLSQADASRAQLEEMVAAVVRLVAHLDAAIEPRLLSLEDALATLAMWRGELEARVDALEAGHRDHESRLSKLERDQAERDQAERDQAERDSYSPCGDGQAEPDWLVAAGLQSELERGEGCNAAGRAAEAGQVLENAEAEGGPAQPEYCLTMEGNFSAKMLTMLRTLERVGLVKVDHGLWSTTHFVLTNDASLPAVIHAWGVNVPVVAEEWLETAHKAIEQRQQLPDPLDDRFRARLLLGACVMIGSDHGSEAETKRLRTRVQQLGGSVCKVLSKVVTHLVVASPEGADAKAQKYKYKYIRLCRAPSCMCLYMCRRPRCCRYTIPMHCMLHTAHTIPYTLHLHCICTACCRRGWLTRVFQRNWSSSAGCSK